MMAFKLMINMVHVACIIVVLLANDSAEAGAIGVNWGRMNAQRLVPSQVVDLLLQNGVGNARIYNSDEDVLKAFAGSGINITLTIFNATSFSTIEEAKKWVQRKAPYFYSCNIRAVYLGANVFADGLVNKPFLNSAINSLQCLQNALKEEGYGDQIKSTFSHFSGILKPNRTKPSESEFQDVIKEEMITFLRFLQENNAPFVIDLFPIIEVTWGYFDPSFAFADNKSTVVVRDINGAVYSNIFEYAYDSFVWALNKLNATNIKIIVGQVGWPTDGISSANALAAERFFRVLLPLVASNKGTPMRPGAPIDTFVHALTDENKMPVAYPYMRHWGIYRSNGQPKYKIDLTGQGRDIYPTMIKGIMRMPERWCLFNGDKTDLDKVKKEFDNACKTSDCTSLAPGGSCSQLNLDQNISYAFNMYFQFQYQDEKACHFSGLGYVSVDNPSTDECVFPVEVVEGQQFNFVDQFRGKGFHERPNCVIFVFLLSLWLPSLGIDRFLESVSAFVVPFVMAGQWV